MGTGPRFGRRTERPINILWVHDNRLGFITTQAHKHAEQMDEEKEFNVEYDMDKWKMGETTSQTETNQREKELVQKADVIVREVPSPSKTGEKRHEGPQAEIRKAIRAGKPIIQVYKDGGHTSSNLPDYIKKYKNKEDVHLDEGQQVIPAVKKAIVKLKQRGLIDTTKGKLKEIAEGNANKKQFRQQRLT